MRFVTTKGAAAGLGEVQAAPSERSESKGAVSFTDALFEGLAPDGGLYVPESIPRWTRDEVAALPLLSLAETGIRVLQRFVGHELEVGTLRAVVEDALDFPIPLVEVEPGVRALELFHGPTLAFKDVGARVMARLMAALHGGGDPLTILVATSGDTGGAVAHAFHDVPHTRVVILYPDRRISPTQEAQLTMFNGDATNVRAYAVAGSFDDCQRLTKEAFADHSLKRAMRLTSANSINVGRLLPQMIYYAHAVGQAGPAAEPTFCTPSGNFGNLTAGLLAKRSGVPIRRFIAATNVNDVVPEYLATGRFFPRASIHTLANAMDVGNPSNFDRMLWLYGGSVDAMRHDVVGSRHDDDEVRTTIKRVYEERGYLLDPHSAIAYLGLASYVASALRQAQGAPSPPGGGFSRTAPGILLATAHPAKFAEIVEPIIGRAISKPPPLADALARARHILHMDATLASLTSQLSAL